MPQRPFQLAPGMYTCPVHDDSTPSLSVGRKPGGGFYPPYCFAGCDPDAILAALGLSLEDLDPAGRRLAWTPAPMPDVSPAEILALADMIERRRVRRLSPWLPMLATADQIRRWRDLAELCRSWGQILALTFGHASPGAWALFDAAAEYERHAGALEMTADA